MDHTGGRGGCSCFWSLAAGAGREESGSGLATSSWRGAAARMRGRSLASSWSRSSSSSSSVERLMQEQRSREAKKAEVTLVPTQVAQLSMAGEAICCLLGLRFVGAGQNKRTRSGEAEAEEEEEDGTSQPTV